MSEFLNPRFSNFKSYVPGEQPRDKIYIKLNTNESPYPPSPQVQACLEGVPYSLRLYSDPECTLLREKLARFYGVEKENVICSNGSDDILNLAFQAFAGGSVRAFFPDITYGFYEVLAALNRVQAVRPKLNKDFTVNIDDYIRADGFVVLANPNAPTGIALTLGDIEKIIQANPDHVVLVDEAYVDFGAESCVPLVHKYKNLLVVMTYSKSRSMAGARIGFAIGDKALIDDMNMLRYAANPYSLSTMALRCAEAAVDSDNYFRVNCLKTEAIRQKVTDKMRNMGFTVLDSQANFVFAKHDKISGEELCQRLRQKGILVRWFDKKRIKNFLRITIGTNDQMDIFLEKLKEILLEVEK